MITPEEARAQAESNFTNGYTCSQAVASVFAEQLGFSKEEICKLAQAFGGGMCRTREVCGSISGMLMALGMLQGSADVRDKKTKDAVYEAGQKLMDEFRTQNGSVVCRELLGLVPLGTSQAQLANASPQNASPDTSMTSPVSEARTPEYYKKRPCAKLCGDAAEIFARYLSQKK